MEVVMVVGGHSLTRKAKPEEETIDDCINGSVFGEGGIPSCSFVLNCRSFFLSFS